MYHVSAQGVDERMINVHYYYYYLLAKSLGLRTIDLLEENGGERGSDGRPSLKGTSSAR